MKEHDKRKTHNKIKSIKFIQIALQHKQIIRQKVLLRFIDSYYSGITTVLHCITPYSPLEPLRAPQSLLQPLLMRDIQIVIINSLSVFYNVFPQLYFLIERSFFNPFQQNLILITKRNNIIIYNTIIAITYLSMSLKQFNQ